jgi:hypothetical protein
MLPKTRAPGQLDLHLDFLERRGGFATEERVSGGHRSYDKGHEHVVMFADALSNG